MRKAKLSETLLKKFNHKKASGKVENIINGDKRTNAAIKMLHYGETVYSVYCKLTLALLF